MKNGLIILGVALLLAGCEEGNGPLASYRGRDRPFATLTIQDSVFTPKITWVGGYSSVLGINLGQKAVLDSTLDWLVYAPGNNLRYPVVVGQLPSGASDLTMTFGGTPIAALSEDQAYTFWIMSDELWGQVSAQTGKILIIDSAATIPVRAQGDTLFLHSSGFTVLKDTVDIFVNIRNVVPGGRLGVIGVVETDFDNNPVVQFTITQTSDTAVSAMGLVIGTTLYNVNNVVWEVLSDDGAGNYRTMNVIESPLAMGTQISGTTTFTPYPANGLIRNREYYFWIATKDWDGVSRTRTANFYAWVVFETW